MKKHSLSIILFLLCLVMSDVFSQTKVDWRQIKNTPTTVSGYGITDVAGAEELERLKNELERVENLIPNNASFTFQGLSETTQAIKDEHIAIDAVTRHKIASGSVTTEKLYDGAVTSNKIATYTIQEFNMGVNSVGTNTLIDYSVIEPKLATDSVSTRAIQDANVTFYKLDYDTQQQIQYPLNNIADNSIVGAKLATQTITNPYLGYSSVADYNLQESSVTGYAIRDYTIENNDIATGTVDSRTIQDFSITNMDLADNSVLTSNIATEAVTSDKLGLLSVGNEHLKTDSVWTHNILNYTILNKDIADNAINGRTIASNSVSTDEIIDSTILPTDLNLDESVTWGWNELTANNLNSDIINMTISAALPTSLQGGIVFYNDDLYLKKVYGWERLANATELLAIPNNASFTLSGLGEKDFASLTNKPTTLSGYGITDAAPTYHSTIETTYGLGTTANYGHVRTINALTQGSHADGTALSAYQGYVLNNAVGTKLDKAGGTISGDLTVSGNITGTVSTATTALNALTADYATEAGSSVSSNNSDFATYAETAHTIVASSTQSADTLPIAFESPAHPNSPSSYSGFYSPTDSTIVMRTGTDSYKFEYNQVTLGEDVTFIGRSADADPEWPNPLYISGSNTATTGGNIALGGYNNPYLALRLKNKNLLSFSDGDIYPVRIASHTYIQGRLEALGDVVGDRVFGNFVQGNELRANPIEESEVPLVLTGAIYYDTTDNRLYLRDNNSWEILNSKNSDFTLAGLSEKSYNSLTDKPTIPTNYAGSSSAGGSATSAEKVNNALTITLNGGTTEGTDKFTYDGSATKTVDISGNPSELENQYRFTMAMSWVRGDYPSDGVATYTDGPAHGKGTYAFNGSVLMPNGKVLLTPYNSPNIGIYDPTANTYTDGPAHGQGTNAFGGSTLMPNGKVMLAPANSPNIGIYDPSDNSYTDGPAHGKSGNLFFSGCTLMPNGKVMLVPFRVGRIGIYDPIANTYTDGPEHGKGDYAFLGCTMMPNGKVMLAPRSSPNIGIYDPIANTYTDGPAHGKGESAFYGCTVMPNGKVMLAPRSIPNIGIYDPIANTYTDGPAHGKGSGAFYDCTMMPNGKVMLAPYFSARIGIYDPIANTYADGPEHGKGVQAFQGCTLMPNGKVMLVPLNSATIGIYDPAINVSAVMGLANFLRLPFFNKL